MNRHALTIDLLAFGLILACLPLPAAGQKFLGKPMAQWVADLAPAKTPMERRSAAFALGKLGKDAVPALGELSSRLGDPDPAVREAAAYAIGEICVAAKVRHAESVAALCKHLTDEKQDPLVRRSAAFALGGMGKADSPDVQAALGAGLKAKDPAVRQNVAWALGRLGDSSAGSLRQALKDPDAQVRRNAAVALTLLTPRAAEPAVPDLLECCKDKDLELRKAAVGALVRLASPKEAVAQQARGPLLALLKDADLEVRRNAALALGYLGGPESTPAVTILRDALKGGVLPLRRQAALALKNIGPDARAALPELRMALHSPDGELKRNAAVALIGFKDAGEPAVPDLVQLVQDRKEDAEVRKQAAVALSRIGYNPALVKAIPGLLAVVADPTEVGGVRERALWPVRVYLSKSEDRQGVFEALTKILSEPARKESRMLRYDLAYLLGMFLGAETPEKALDILDEFLKDRAIQIYGGITPGGKRIGEEPKGGGTTQEVGLGDGRIMAVDALSEIGAARVAKRPEMVQRLRALYADPKTAPNLRAALERFMPLLEAALKKR
jgi:HEAT repeat protein